MCNKKSLFLSSWYDSTWSLQRKKIPGPQPRSQGLSSSRHLEREKRDGSLLSRYRGRMMKDPGNGLEHPQPWPLPGMAGYPTLIPNIGNGRMLYQTAVNVNMNLTPWVTFPWGTYIIVIFGLELTLSLITNQNKWTHLYYFRVLFTQLSTIYFKNTSLEHLSLRVKLQSLFLKITISFFLRKIDLFLQHCYVHYLH